MTVPTGSLSLPLVGLEKLLADSPTFRASVGAANADVARQRIHFTTLESFDEALALAAQRPAVILMPESFGYDQMGQGAAIDMGARGGFIGIFIKNTIKSQDEKEITLDFTNWLGGVIDDCSDRVGRGEYWPFRRIGILEGPNRADLEERAADDYWAAAVLFSHNVTEQ